MQLLNATDHLENHGPHDRLPLRAYIDLQLPGPLEHVALGSERGDHRRVRRVLRDPEESAAVGESNFIEKLGTADVIPRQLSLMGVRLQEFLVRLSHPASGHALDDDELAIHCVAHEIDPPVIPGSVLEFAHHLVAPVFPCSDPLRIERGMELLGGLDVARSPTFGFRSRRVGSNRELSPHPMILVTSRETAALSRISCLSSLS
mmetsp:Transcript_56908/g.123131  ORF Transcript_56908/g.123131 Transcript_56908/m.123131 type:complete len:204 (+) Transcript_56908:666-1277(+)